jgi:two-component system sensor histidine kinase RegB
MDDGPGFSMHILGRIGDPFMRARNRPRRSVARPEYEGMGLGLFIAKTLLERSGAQLRFANGPGGPQGAKGTGAVVEVIWPRNALEAETVPQGQPMGENRHFPG